MIRPGYSAGFRVSLRYMTDTQIDWRQHPTLAVRSPLATGKTEFIKRVIIEHGENASVVYVTHLQNLVENAVERLNRPSPAGELSRPMHLYREIDGSLINLVDRVAITVDSIMRWQRDKLTLLVIDEFSQAFRHIAAGTLKGRRAMIAFRALKRLIQLADYVIILDAHLTDRDCDLIRQLRPQHPLAALQNEYRHSWGDLHFHETETTLIHCALETATNNTKPVIVTSDSRHKLEKFEQLAVDRFGSKAVLMISSQTSASFEVSALKGDLSRLANYKIIMTSPTWGTGIDVQEEVAGVYGLFYPQPWNAATTIMQQMMRFRCAKQRHIFVAHKNLARNEETNWQIIRDRHLAKAAHTARTASLQDLAMSTDQRQLLDFLAKYDAERAAQRVDLFSHVVALASDEGFTPDFITGYIPAIKQQITAATEMLNDTRKQMTMTHTPVPPEEMECIERQALSSSEQLRQLYAGNHRWIIEDITGRAIDDWSYDRLHTPGGKHQFTQGVDFLAYLIDQDSLKQLDRQEAETDTLLMHRANRMAKARLIQDGLETIYPGICQLINTDQIDAIATTYAPLFRDDIREQFSPFSGRNRDVIRLFFQQSGNYSDDPIHVLRTLLRQFGMELKYTKARDKKRGKQSYIYRVDVVKLKESHARFLTALAHREEKRSELQSDLKKWAIPTAVQHPSPVSTVTTAVVEPPVIRSPMRPEDWDLSLL